MKSFRLLLIAVVAAVAPLASAEPTKAPAALGFLRSTDAAEKARMLQTASVEFRPTRGAGASILLVGVAHLGTTEYYHALQQRLDRATAVLYEGVGLKDVKQGPGTMGGDAGVQGALAKALGLKFQLDVIDYRRPHFINSDLHVPELQAEVKKRSTTEPGAPAPDAMLDQLMDALQGTGMAGGALNQMIGFLGATPQMQEMTKMMLVEVLSQAGEFLELAKGLSPEMKDLFDVLLTQRNAIVMRDLRTQLARHSAGDTIAVFYGAAHMDEIAMRLRDELGYVAGPPQWDTAFTADSAKSGIDPAQIRLMLDMVRQQLPPPTPAK